MRDPARLYLLAGSGLDTITTKPTCGHFTEYVRRDLVPKRKKARRK